MTYMAWLDIETTGLQPEHDFILEVGLVITDAYLQPLDRVNVVITEYFMPFQRLFALADPYVQSMHEKSGLWETIRNAENDHDQKLGMKNSIFTAEYAVRTLMQKYFTDPVEGYQAPPMCGSSVHFDRAFLAVSGRGINSLFGYRNIDVSTVKELAERWAPDVFATRPGQNDEDKAHRVIPDILASIDELRHYRDSDFIRSTRQEA